VLPDRDLRQSNVLPARHHMLQSDTMRFHGRLLRRRLRRWRGVLLFWSRGGMLLSGRHLVLPIRLGQTLLPDRI
jgi:hypothetical protein